MIGLLQQHGSASLRCRLCCIIISVSMATLTLSASTAKDAVKQWPTEPVDNSELELDDLTSKGVESLPAIPAYDVTSGLAMLPKMKPLNYDKDIEFSDKNQDYNQEEFLERKLDDVDLEFLARFLKSLNGYPQSDTEDHLPISDETEQAQNASEDEITAAKESDMTSLTNERHKRSASNHVAMTSEHMTSGGTEAGRPLRVKRGLGDYSHSRRWMSSDDYELPSAENAFLTDRFEDYSSDDDDDDESFAEVNGDDVVSQSQLRQYRKALLAAQERRHGLPGYLPVVYRGVKGIFLPESSLVKLQAQSSPYSVNEVQSAADKWSLLVLNEVKKALDEYDVVYRLADALRHHDI